MSSNNQVCDECDFPLDESGDCTNSSCPTNTISEHDILNNKDNRPEDEDELAQDDMYDPDYDSVELDEQKEDERNDQ